MNWWQHPKAGANDRDYPHRCDALASARCHLIRARAGKNLCLQSATTCPAPLSGNAAIQFSINQFAASGRLGRGLAEFNV
jgi:hypothetical protein